jgi:hypothetical protein
VGGRRPVGAETVAVGRAAERAARYPATVSRLSNQGLRERLPLGLQGDVPCRAALPQFAQCWLVVRAGNPCLGLVRSTRVLESSINGSVPTARWVKSKST